MNIYVAGPLGFERANKLYIENREFVRKRFPGFYLERFEKIAREAENAKRCPEKWKGRALVREITEGGLYRALWEVGSETGCGLEVDIITVPVRQEVIEILELFNEDPFESVSAGSFIICSDEEHEILPENGIKASLIGRTTSTKGRILKMAEGIRYLTPPERQEKDILAREKDLNS